MSKFELLVGGERYSGWKSIRLTRGLERAVSDFTLSVSERWPLQERPEPWQIAPGDECKIYIDDELVLTGFTDKYEPRVDGTNHEVSVAGRSKTMDFVDSSITIDGGQFKGLNILQIARLLAQPFGLEVIADTPSDAVRDTTLADELTAEPETQCQPSETCFDFVERLARLQELLITDDFEGRLVLTRAGSKRADDKLTQGANVKSASAKLDNSKRFSHYTVKAQRPGNRTKDKKSASKKLKDPFYHDLIGGQSAELSRTLWRERMRLLRSRPVRDVQYAPLGAAGGLLERAPRDAGDDFGDDFDSDADFDEEPPVTEPGPGGGADKEADRGSRVLTQIVGTARDEGITRYRPKVIIAEQQADDGNAAKRADWEMRRRFAKAHEVTITVNGWHQRSGKLWTPNMMVAVEMPWLSLEREMLISTVDYVYSSDEGEVCTFTITLPDAFLPEKFRKAKAKAKGKGRGRKGKKAKVPPVYYADLKPGQ